MVFGLCPRVTAEYSPRPPDPGGGAALRRGSRVNRIALFGEVFQAEFMPQVQLPVFPSGCSPINDNLAFERRENQVTYFNGHLPVFTHEAEDLQTFRMFTSQLIVNGSASQREISEAFGVSLTTIKRYVKKFRQEGVRGLFVPAARRQGSKLTPEVLAQAQTMLNRGQTVPSISRALDVLPTTLHKALDDGRLAALKKKSRR
jgi:transposase